MSITIIGSLNYDLVTYTDKVPLGGETIQANSFENHLGGKGLNEAIAVARLTPKSANIPIRMIGRIGDDSFGKELKNALEIAHVDVSHVKTIKDVSSGVAVIIVEQETGENRILITSGANGQLKPTEEEYQQYFPDSKGYVLLQNEYPDTEKSIGWIKHNRPLINIAYNPSPYKSEYIKNGILGGVDLLIVNEGEALDVSKTLLSDQLEFNDIKGFESLALELVKLINPHNINVVIITMGSKGCVYAGKHGAKFEPSVKVDSVVDTTGAGDTFFGGVVSKLACGYGIEDAIKSGTKASSLVIQKKGAVESIPTYDDLI